MNSPVLFLDFDGPIFSTRAIRQLSPCKEKLKFFSQFLTSALVELTYHRADPIAIEMLNHVLQETKAQVCFSTSWANFMTVEGMQLLMADNGLRFQLHRNPTIGRTGKTRIESIHNWLQENDVTKFAILDDPGSGSGMMDNSLLHHLGIPLSRVVLVDCNFGMENFHKENLRNALLA